MQGIIIMDRPTVNYDLPSPTYSASGRWSSSRAGPDFLKVQHQARRMIFIKPSSPGELPECQWG